MGERPEKRLAVCRYRYSIILGDDALFSDTASLLATVPH